MTEPRVRGEKIAEGKTKIVYADPEKRGMGLFESKSDITWGDGLGHEQMQGKAVLSTETTCNNFRLYAACGIPVAYDGRVDEKTFGGHLCAPNPVEVVITRRVVAKSSFAAQNPQIPLETSLRRLDVRWYLKSSNKDWRGTPLVEDDPLMEGHLSGDPIRLYRKKEAFGKPFLTLRFESVFPDRIVHQHFPAMDAIGRKLFLVHEHIWAAQGVEAVDLKIEFGIDASGQLRVIDVVDADSGRYRIDGKFQDKQQIREGASIEAAKPGFELLAELSKRHRLPKSDLVVWRGSPDDDLKVLDSLLWKYALYLRPQTVTCSAHKETARAITELQNIEASTNRSAVIIAYVGRSNGLGPFIAGNTTMSCVTVPKDWRDHPHSVYSSLDMPSGMPLKVVGDLPNAVEAAVGELARTNAALYMLQRYALEKRLT